jgi:hypothetical protein
MYREEMGRMLAAAGLRVLRGLSESYIFLCLRGPLCSYLNGELYGGLYGGAVIIRYFPP